MDGASASTEEKFYAAVELIKNLPKSGSLQPSNDLKLKFYSFYKQATEGPCELPRPSFWDIVNRAKWDAWNKLGNMSKEEAMMNYVDEFTDILKSTPLDDANSLKEYVHLLGPYMEFVPKELQNVQTLMNGKVKKPVNSEDPIERCNLPNPGKPLKDRTNEFLESSDGLLFGSSINGHSVNGNNESDSDEFSDTLDRVNESDLEEFDGSLLTSSLGAQNNPISNIKGSTGVNVRGGGDQKVGSREGNSAAGNVSGNRGNRSSRPPQNANHSLHHSLPISNSSGSGGSRRNGGNLSLEPASDVNEQLAMAIIRLQHIMEQVVERLSSLEAILIQRKATHPIEGVASKRSYWSLLGISPRAAVVILAWPFIVHWLVYLIRKRNRRL